MQADWRAIAEKLQREVKELREQSDRFCDKYLTALKRAEAAEAREARLSEARDDWENEAGEFAKEVDRLKCVIEEMEQERNSFDTHMEAVKRKYRNRAIEAERAAHAALSGSGSGSGWRAMDSAPKDGTRIIIKAVTFGWSSDVCQNVATGDKAIEARWAKGLSNEYNWLKWCGNERTHSTDGALVALGWMPMPLPAAPQTGGE